MKEHLLSLLSNIPNPLQTRNQAREYLQALILQSFQRAGAMIPLAFRGSTALRFLYNSQRYSEDLDFSLDGNARDYDFHTYLQSIRHDLEAQGYVLALKVNDQKAVQSAFVRFPGLLFDMGLSPHKDEVLAVKIEVDTHPPQGKYRFSKAILAAIIRAVENNLPSCFSFCSFIPRSLGNESSGLARTHAPTGPLTSL